VLDRCPVRDAGSLEAILAADAEARACAREAIGQAPRRASS